MYFGYILYHRICFSDDAELIADSIQVCAAEVPGFVGRGMFPATATFSKRMHITPRALREVMIDLKGGVYGSVVALSRGRTNDFALSITNAPDDTPVWGGDAQLIRRTDASQSDIEAVEVLSAKLWDRLRPGCGISLWSETQEALESEVSGIPIRFWTPSQTIPKTSGCSRFRISENALV